MCLWNVYSHIQGRRIQIASYFCSLGGCQCTSHRQRACYWGCLSIGNGVQCPISLFAWCQGQPTGRLLRYDPATRRTHVVADGIWFANGVALSRDGSYVAVVETVSMRVKRVWLTGEREGQVDVLLDELPGCAFLAGFSCFPAFTRRV